MEYICFFIFNIRHLLVAWTCLTNETLSNLHGVTWRWQINARWPGLPHDTVLNTRMGRDSRRTTSENFVIDIVGFGVRALSLEAALWRWSWWLIRDIECWLDRPAIPGCLTPYSLLECYEQNDYGRVNALIASSVLSLNLRGGRNNNTYHQVNLRCICNSVACG